MGDFNFTLEDNSDEILKKMEEAAFTFCHEAGSEIASQAKRNSRVDSGQVKNSWHYKTTRYADRVECNVGSPLENAIWEEFGTGEYALDGTGRHTPWYVPVIGYTGRKPPTYKGKVEVIWAKNGKPYFKTDGKKPNRALWNAFEKLRSKLIARGESIFKERLK